MNPLRTRLLALIAAAYLCAACATRDPASSNLQLSLPADAAAIVKTASTASDADIVNQDLIKRGYRLKKLNGRQLYCKTEVLTGTHFSNSVCLSEAQLKALDRDTQNSKDRMGRQTIMPCPSSAGCN
jgi:hypothetical protein